MRRNKTLLGVAAVLVWAGSWPPACAQQETTPDHVGRLQVGTKLVVLDIAVTGKDGRPVDGLTKDDFKVYEDGVQQTIRNVDHTGTQPDATPTRVNTVFVLDNLNNQLLDSGYGKAQLLRYLRTQPAVLEQPSMLVAVSDDGFKMIVPYTRDRDALIRAGDAHKLGLPFDLARQDQEARIGITFDAVRQIALAGAGTPGRTELVWLGRGFPSINLQALTQDTVDALHASIAELTRLLLESRMVVYKVDPAAVGGPSILPDIDNIDDTFQDTAAPFADSISFDDLVVQTGGHSYFNRNDVDAELRSAVDEGRTFYTIAYRPTSESQAVASYRAIRVKIDRPGLHAVTKKGYFVAPEATSETPQAPTIPPEKTVDLAIINNLAYTGFRVELNGFHLAADGDTLCRVRLNPKDVAWQAQPDGTHALPLIVGIATYGARDKPLHYSRTTMTLRLPASDTGEAAMQSSTVDIPITLPPSALRLRIVILQRDTGKLGSIDTTTLPKH